MYASTQGVEQHRVAQFTGGLAQLGEHLLCKQGVNGSIPLTSTIKAVDRWKLTVDEVEWCVVSSSKNPYLSLMASILAFADKMFFKNLEEVNNT